MCVAVLALPHPIPQLLNGDAVGTKVSGRHRQGGRLSGVVVKRGSTVVLPEPYKDYILRGSMLCMGEETPFFHTPTYLQ